MRPPVCALCRRRFGPDEGGLVSFARDPADADWYRRAEAPGFTGHPPHQEWFCGAHVTNARDVSELTRSAALARLKSDA